MSSESILLAFQSAFPTLYAVPEAGSEESSSATGDAAHAEVPAPVAEPSADDSERQQQGAPARPSLGAGDPYFNKVERITGKVGHCSPCMHVPGCMVVCMHVHGAGEHHAALPWHGGHTIARCSCRINQPARATTMQGKDWAWHDGFAGSHHALINGMHTHAPMHRR